MPLAQAQPNGLKSVISGLARMHPLRREIEARVTPYTYFLLVSRRIPCHPSNDDASLSKQDGQQQT